MFDIIADIFSLNLTMIFIRISLEFYNFCEKILNTFFLKMIVNKKSQSHSAEKFDIIRICLDWKDERKKEVST